MSARGYTVTIKLMDKNGVLARLERLQRTGIVGALEQRAGAKTAPGFPARRGAAAAGERVAESLGLLAGGGFFGRLGDTFQKLEGIGLKQILKLTGIGLGIAGIFGLVMKSSGILQGVLKIFQTSILLIFKPIGDFIGLMLRPIMIAFLKDVVIPFNKVVLPWVREWGPKIGEALLKLPELLLGFAPEIAKLVGNAGSTVQTSFEIAGTNLQAVWDIFVKGMSENFIQFDSNLGNMLAGVPQTISNTFSTLANNLLQWLANIPSMISMTFSNLANQLLQWLAGVPGVINAIFTDLATDLWTWLAGVPGVINAIFTDLATNLWTWLEGAPNTIYTVFTDLAAKFRNTLADLPGIIRRAIESFIRALLKRGSSSAPFTFGGRSGGASGSSNGMTQIGTTTSSKTRFATFTAGVAATVI